MSEFFLISHLLNFSQIKSFFPVREIFFTSGIKSKAPVGFSNTPVLPFSPHSKAVTSFFSFLGSFLTASTEFRSDISKKTSRAVKSLTIFEFFLL